MKNLKLENEEKMVNRAKLTRKGLSITAALLIGTTLLSGCGKKNVSYNTLPNSYTSTSDSTKDTTSYIAEDNFTYENTLTKEEIEELNSKLNQNVKMTDINFAGFQNYLSQLETPYHYEELYGIEEAFEKMYHFSTPKVEKHQNDFLGSDHKFTYEEIYRVVIANNKKYQQENGKQNGKINFYKELDNSQVQRVCSLITEVLNHYLENNLIHDEKELSCILGDLKVLRDNTSFSNAYVTDDNCLLISPNMLEIMDLMNKDNTFDQTVVHEIEHLLQKQCQDNLKKDSKTVGICHRYDELEVNPLYFDWFFESSAEKEACNYLNASPLVYKNMIGYLESVSLATILYSDVEANQTERLCMSKDLNKLFEQFHCENEKDKKDVIKLMFAVDIIQNDDEEFVKKYEEKYGITLTSNDLLNIKYELKPDICRGYLKSFYKSLSVALKQQEIPLQDVFYLIRLTEADVNNHILYDDKTKIDYNKDFLVDANSMRQEFFQSLECGYTQEELTSMYQDYQMVNMNNKAKEKYNCNLVWLNAEKREYLQARSDFLAEYSKSPITENKNLLMQKNK